MITIEFKGDLRGIMSGLLTINHARQVLRETLISRYKKAGDTNTSGTIYSDLKPLDCYYLTRDGVINIIKRNSSRVLSNKIQTA